MATDQPHPHHTDEKRDNPATVGARNALTAAAPDLTAHSTASTTPAAGATGPADAPDLTAHSTASTTPATDATVVAGGLSCTATPPGTLLRPVAFSDPAFPTVRALIEEALPAHELVPWELLEGLCDPDAGFIGLFDEKGGDLLACAYGVATPDALYALYLAVDHSHRGRGLGGAMVRALVVWAHGRPIYLEAEAADEKDAPNLEQRCRRLAFYGRHGLLDSGATTVETVDGVETRYFVLTNDPGRRVAPYVAALKRFYGHGYEPDVREGERP